MNFFKKKDDMEKKSMLPELPAMPKLPELPSLPSLHQSAMKDEFRPLIQNRDFEIRKIDLENIPRIPQKSDQPVFIKLDKFQDAVHKFEEVKSKVKDIENSLIKIKDIKSKEEIELKAWEQEVQMIKEKVSNIEGSLFSKL
jgi:hypothetical protein